MFKDVALGQLRHYLSGAGVYLIAQGVTDAGTWEQVIGAVMTIAGIGWSVIDKYLAGRIAPKPPATS